ncbi:MAG: hypothetical protein V7746_19605 [Halioglobus sp.]
MRLLLIALSMLSMVVQADSEYKEFTGSSGMINWSNGTVTAEGNGTSPAGGNPKTSGLLACRAAIADAQRNLLEATEGVRVSSQTYVKDFTVSSDEIRTSVEGVIRGATVLDRADDGSGFCKVVLRMPMAGKLSKSVYAETFSGDEQATSFSLPRFLSGGLISEAHAATQPEQDTWSTAYEVLSTRLTAIEKKLAIIPERTLIEHSDTMPSGLVVDARGSNFIPSLSPNIRQIRGGIIYPNTNAQGAILGSGKLVALFARDVDFAIRHPRVGDRPLVVKGLRTWGETRTEIVLGKESSGKVSALAKTDFFSAAGVIIVLD